MIFRGLNLESKESGKMAVPDGRLTDARPVSEISLFTSILSLESSGEYEEP